MKRFNNFVEEYKQQRKEAKKAKLQKKYEVKPFSEEYTALNGISFYSSFLLQVLSLVTAVTLIAYWVKVACNSWVVGFITGGIILFLLELLKRFLVGKAVQGALQFNRYASFAGFFALVFSAASITFSTFGTPIMITEFGAGPTLKDTSTLSINHQNQIASINAFWMPQIEKAEKDAKDTHKKNNWKGVTTRSARPTVLRYQQQAQGYRDSLNNALAIAAKDYKNDVLSVENENKAAIQENKQNKASVGFIFMFVTLGLELLFMLAKGWCEYYDYRTVLEIEKEQEVQQSSEEQQPDNVRDINDSGKKKRKIQQAKDLRADGKSWREIGDTLGVSHMTAKRYAQA